MCFTLSFFYFFSQYQQRFQQRTRERLERAAEREKRRELEDAEEEAARKKAVEMRRRVCTIKSYFIFFIHNSLITQSFGFLRWWIGRSDFETDFFS